MSSPKETAAVNSCALPFMVMTVTLMLKLHPYGSCREERQGPQLAIFHGRRHSAGTEAIGDKVEHTTANAP
jgi:hypothetical protein